MNRAYLLVYSDRVGSRQKIKTYLSSRQEILHWRYDLPNAFYLLSHLSLDELYDLVQEFNREKGRFLITEIGDNIQGWLPERTWNLLHNEEHGASS